MEGIGVVSCSCEATPIFHKQVFYKTGIGFFFLNKT